MTGEAVFYQIYGSIAVFLFGLVVGSFNNVAAFRIPEGKSLWAPRSFCPQCGSTIVWHDNIPLLSYAILRGQCRNCHESIPARYPLVELVTGLLYLAVFAKCGFEWRAEFLPYIFMVTVLVIVSAIDIQKQIIPNKIIYPAIPAGLAAMGAVSAVRGDANIILHSLIGLAIGGIPLGLLALAIPKGMGMGDAKLAAFTGVFLGYYQAIALFFAFLLGSIFGITLMVLGRKGRKSRIPFGPYLAAGAIIALFWGPQFWDFYRGLF
jgi:leader peptidase (prepilin peptidase)/N-methyltransferase